MDNDDHAILHPQKHVFSVSEVVEALNEGLSNVFEAQTLMQEIIDFMGVAHLFTSGPWKMTENVYQPLRKIENRYNPDGRSHRTTLAVDVNIKERTISRKSAERSAQRQPGFGGVASLFRDESEIEYNCGKDGSCIVTCKDSWAGPPDGKKFTARWGLVDKSIHEVPNAEKSNTSDEDRTYQIIIYVVDARGALINIAVDKELSFLFPGVLPSPIDMKGEDRSWYTRTFSDFYIICTDVALLPKPKQEKKRQSSDGVADKPKESGLRFGGVADLFADDD